MSGRRLRRLGGVHRGALQGRAHLCGVVLVVVPLGAEDLAGGRVDPDAVPGAVAGEDVDLPGRALPAVVPVVPVVVLVVQLGGDRGARGVREGGGDGVGRRHLRGGGAGVVAPVVVAPVVVTVVGLVPYAAVVRHGDGRCVRDVRDVRAGRRTPVVVPVVARAVAVPPPISAAAVTAAITMLRFMRFPPSRPESSGFR